MNREILFKAKRKDSGEWVEGYYFYNANIKKHYIKTWICHYEVDQETICQYTGLNDKNGMKIWENDILKCGVNSVVVWNKKYASWCLRKKRWLYDQFFGDSVEPEDVEVVGNTFDNPELLEVR